MYWILLQKVNAGRKKDNSCASNGLSECFPPYWNKNSMLSTLLVWAPGYKQH